MASLLERLLRSLLGPLLPAVDASSERTTDPMESQTGVHLYHAMGAEHELFSEVVDKTTVLAAIRSVDWENEFSQVFAVVHPGTWLEVGGSLAPEHGLSAAYVNRSKRVDIVIHDPPNSVACMEAVMLRFLESEDELFSTYEFS